MSKPEPETDRGPTFADLLTELIEIAGRPDVGATASVLLMDLAGALGAPERGPAMTATATAPARHRCHVCGHEARGAGADGLRAVPDRPGLYRCSAIRKCVERYANTPAIQVELTRQEHEFIMEWRSERLQRPNGKAATLAERNTS